jgi:hypothetical protein
MAKAFIAMEFMEGATLKHRIADEPLPLEEVLEWGSEIADALGAAHSKGIFAGLISKPHPNESTEALCLWLRLETADMKIVPVAKSGDLAIPHASALSISTSRGSGCAQRCVVTGPFFTNLRKLSPTEPAAMR